MIVFLPRGRILYRDALVLITVLDSGRLGSSTRPRVRLLPVPRAFRVSISLSTISCFLFVAVPTHGD